MSKRYSNTIPLNSSIEIIKIYKPIQHSIGYKIKWGMYSYFHSYQIKDTRDEIKLQYKRSRELYKKTE